MPEYRVTWEIDIDAETAEEAAWAALRIQRDHMSTAVVFDVSAGANIHEIVDLEKIMRLGRKEAL